METLYQRGLQSLLVEGGSQLLQSFIDSSLWDEAFVEKTPLMLHNGVSAPRMDSHFSYDTVQHFGHDVRHYYAERLCK